MFAFHTLGVKPQISPAAAILINAFILCLVSSAAIYKLVFKPSKYIAELAKTNDALKKERAKSESILASIGDAVSIHDTDFKIIYQNKAAIAMGGGHIGEYCYKAYEHNRKICESCQLEMTFEDGKVRAMQRESMTGNVLKYLEITASPLRDSTGKIVAGIEVIRDLTDRRRSEKVFRKTANTLRILVDASPLAIIALTLDGIITSWNPAAERIFGWRQEEVTGLFSPIVPDDKKEEFESHLHRVRNGETLTGKRVKRRKKDGSLLDLNLAVSPIKDENATVSGMIALLEDITDRVRLEEQLRHAQKMEEMGRLAGGVAHDFNNILSAIIGYSDLVKIKLKDDALAPYMEQVLLASQRAANLTKSLLAFSRKQAISLRPVDLETLVKEFEKFLLRVVREDIEISIKCSGGGLIVMADSGQIEQVLMNLAVNARDAMPNGGKLLISAGGVFVSEETTRANNFQQPGRYALISVTDTGAGMDQNVKKRIFDPFFTTKEIGQGTGLGLSIIYGIIEQHGGHIDVQSEPGSGTTFEIYLPLAKIQTEQEREDSGKESPRGGAEPILVAEDDPALRHLTSTILREYGYRVIEAENGEEAVNKFLEKGDEVKLLILDVIMPRKNGKEVYEEIKKVKPGMRAIFISGYAADIINRSDDLGPQAHFISKPIIPNVLLKKIREILDSSSA